MASSTSGSDGGVHARGYGHPDGEHGLRDIVMRHLRNRSCREMSFKLLDPATKIVPIDAAAVEAADLRHALPKRHYFAPFPSLRLPAASVWFQFNRNGKDCGIQAETSSNGCILLRHVALRADGALILPHAWTWIDPSVFPPNVQSNDSAGDEAPVNVAADQAWAEWVPKALLPIAADPLHVLTAKTYRHWLRWVLDDLALLTLAPSAGGVGMDPGSIHLAS